MTDARELLIAALGQYGAEVTAVATVAEAIEALQRLQPNVLVILACQEKMAALIRKLAPAAEQGGQIPVALTAYARAEDHTGYIGGLSAHVPASPSS